MSHIPSAVRHATPAGKSTLPGHANDDPSQSSAESQLPDEARHIVPPSAARFAGQSVLVPLQTASSWHSAAAALQTVPTTAMVSTGQAADVPVQVSATSQVDAAPRQTIVAGANPSAGHATLTLVQVSARSQAGAAPRQTTVGAAVAERAAHVPSAPPVSAALHAWQSFAPPAHAVLQHTPSVQKPLTQAASPPQVEPVVPNSVNTRALPALTPPAVSSKGAPTSARLPSDVSATE